MLKFRSAEIHDQPHLNQISFRSKKYWGYSDEWMENWADDLFISSANILEDLIQIAEVDDSIIGFCCLSEETKYFEIQHLWLLPEFIGKGYGKELLNYTIGLVDLKLKPIQVLSDPNAEEFYRKQGFLTIDKIESYPPGRFLPLMKKNRIS